MTIDRFDGTKYRFLSNFWPSEVVYDGEVYPTVEHAYQAAKTLDVNARRAIREASTPGKAKRLGQKVVYRENWENLKYTVMEELLKQKFKWSDSGCELGNLLEETGDQELIEGNTWGDVYWGVCDGKGQNNLGKILMDIRSDLHQQSEDW
jgi:ribA/ribD-fused uncharacterized protein